MEACKVKFRVGSDPEVLLHNGHQLVSCIGLVNGNKWNPLQVEGMAKGFTLQQDNVALEFGIPPAASKKEFVEYIRQVMEAGKGHTGLSFAKTSCEVFPESEMQTAEAHIFGCEPDYNAWTGRVNKSPSPPHPFMRSAGGHVHIETQLNQRAVVRAADLFLGLRSLFLDKQGAKRRQLYGKAGAYRRKSYGPEYRTLSNYWIFSKALTGKVWDGVAESLEFVAKGNDVTDKRVRMAIDTSNLQMAQDVMQYYGVKL